jgi:hypothetical protein
MLNVEPFKVEGSVNSVIIFNNPVRTAKKTPRFSITKISFVTLFEEIILVHTENRTKHVSKDADRFIIKAGET